MKARLGAFFFRYRNVLGPVLFVLALLAGTPDYPFGQARWNRVFDGAGTLLVLLGEALRVLTIGYAYIERGGKDRRVHAIGLVQGGMFGQCRNPLYVGNMLIALGFALIVHSPAFYAIVLPFVLLSYCCIVAAEEAFLAARFGAEYAAYCRRVHRWRPRLAGWKRSIAGMRFNWRRVLVKEYNTIFIATLALVAITFWSDYRIAGATALPRADTMLAGATAWLVLYLLVRSLKKSGYVSA